MIPLSPFPSGSGANPLSFFSSFIILRFKSDRGRRFDMPCSITESRWLQSPRRWSGVHHHPFEVIGHPGFEHDKVGCSILTLARMNPNVDSLGSVDMDPVVHFMTWCMATVQTLHHNVLDDVWHHLRGTNRGIVRDMGFEPGRIYIHSSREWARGCPRERIPSTWSCDRTNVIIPSATMSG